MDFIGGALPNVMFLVGIIAIGVGLGLEFKIIEVKGQLSRTSRLVAVGLGTALIFGSVALYLRPSGAGTATAPALAPATAEAPVATAAPAPTAAPSDSAPASLPAPTQPEQEMVPVPDLTGMSLRDAERALAAAGLAPGEPGESCRSIGAPEPEGEPRKDRVICQDVAFGAMAPAGSAVRFVLAEK